MEFPTLGQHCSQEGCQQLDFLPFECAACKRIFCLAHSAYSSHNCTATSDARVPECPLCGAPVPIAKGDDINAKVEQHISAGCPQTKVQHTNTCSYPRCRKYEVVPVICKQCYKNFCLSHRFPQDHACEGVTGGVASKAREQHKKPSSSSSSSASKSAHSHNPTALKVRLMKMKMQAKGDAKIPADKRFYLEVVFPLNSGVAPKLMYFDPRWSIGKVLDLVAEAGNIVNKNNVIQEKNSKLHLIALKTGEPLPNEKHLDTLSADVLQSGDAVMLDTLQALSP